MMLRCPPSILEKTLQSLRDAGDRKNEGVVLWLSPRQALHAGPAITESYVPSHHAEFDYFHIPAYAMRELFGHLKNNKLAIAAQVHSHPGQAFHSKADDEWALPSHVGALSIVVPDFCREVTLTSFPEAAAVFQLSDDGIWTPAPYQSTMEIST